MPVAAPPVLAIEKLSLDRGDTRILRQISWTVEAGQRWVILGANGSGKTALLSALTAYFPPSRGEIRFQGQRFGECDWRLIRRSIGLVSSAILQRIEDDALPLTTVAAGRDAVLNPWAAPPETHRGEALRLLRSLGAGALAARPWLFLSQGERQRVLIARALMARPALLILDEPCSGLDPVAREDFLRRMDRLAARPNAPALVLVTHHVEEITEVYTHALILRKGSVVASGPIADTLTDAHLRRTFGVSVRLLREAGRFRLRTGE